MARQRRHGERVTRRKAAAAAMVAAVAAVVMVAPATTPAAPQIMEDSPAWNCAEMGNRICGGDSITPDGWEADTGAYVGGWN
jgi:Spy/CpxP family protein refolding chaperone